MLTCTALTCTGLMIPKRSPCHWLAASLALPPGPSTVDPAQSSFSFVSLRLSVTNTCGQLAAQGQSQPVHGLPCTLLFSFIQSWEVGDAHTLRQSQGQTGNLHMEDLSTCDNSPPHTNSHQHTSARTLLLPAQLLPPCPDAAQDPKSLPWLPQAGTFILM